MTDLVINTEGRFSRDAFQIVVSLVTCMRKPVLIVSNQFSLKLAFFSYTARVFKVMI